MAGVTDRAANHGPDVGWLLPATEVIAVLAYLAILFSKVESCHYPSKALLDRIARWTLAAS